MSFAKIRNIPSPEEIISMVPLAPELKKIKDARDEELRSISTGASSKFIVIVGPCSADEEDPVCEYVSRLARVNEKVSEKLFVIPRIYTNKPRTTGEGYMGMLHQPNPDEEANMLDGILAIRRMHVRAIRESGLTAADEMLYTDNLVYCEDMLSYIAVGARSVEDQQHRLAASGIGMPVGMKNPTSGDLTVLFNSIQAAQASHSFIYQGNEVRTSGNELAHAVLRGSVSKHGANIPNYHYEDLSFAAKMYRDRGLKNPMVIVDCNHANSGKLFYEQPRITKEVLHSRKYDDNIRQLVRGFMLESYLIEGNQSIGAERVYGKSITDACLGWEDTERLIYNIAENV
ncbi:MAG: 3-deoxy-7-phosphoheptulonate synthase [Clostridiales bacterium]|jgi:3-deoxy-7-phosphoheptulonate synthase|nr:3-deoxy-7-phosphoheptulonate synthase [Clostridiales bacterium]